MLKVLKLILPLVLAVAPMPVRADVPAAAADGAFGRHGGGA